MIIVLKPGVSEEQLNYVVERIESLGLKAHLSRGTYRTIIGVIGDETKLQAEPLRAIPGVADVVPILPPYKLASIEAQPKPSIVEVGGGNGKTTKGVVKIGGGHLGMIAGPCAVESHERLDAIAAVGARVRGQHPSRRGLQAADQPLFVPRAG